MILTTRMILTTLTADTPHPGSRSPKNFFIARPGVPHWLCISF